MATNTRFLFVDACIFRNNGFDRHTGPLAALRRLVESGDVIVLLTSTLKREVERLLQRHANEYGQRARQTLERLSALGVVQPSQVLDAESLAEKFVTDFMDFLDQLKPHYIGADEIPFGTVQAEVYRIEGKVAKNKKGTQHCDVAAYIALRNWSEQRQHQSVEVISSDGDWTAILQDESWASVAKALPNDGVNLTLLTRFAAWHKHEPQTAPLHLQSYFQGEYVYDSAQYGYVATMTGIREFHFTGKNTVDTMNEPTNGSVMGKIMAGFKVEVDAYHDARRSFLKVVPESNLGIGSLDGSVLFDFEYDEQEGPDSAKFRLANAFPMLSLGPWMFKWNHEAIDKHMDSA